MILASVFRVTIVRHIMELSSQFPCMQATNAYRAVGHGRVYYTVRSTLQILLVAARGTTYYLLTYIYD